VCIVCNRAIESHLAPAEEADAGAANSDGESSQPPAHRKKPSNGTGAGAAAATHHKSRVQHHHHHGPVTRIRRNHSSGKLVGRGKTGTLKALSTHHKDHSSTTAAASTSDNGHASEGESNDDATSGKTSPAPAWTSLYCSEECRKEDELSSRLSYANLSEQKEKISARSYQQQHHFHQLSQQQAQLNNQRRSSSHVSLQQMRSTSPSSPPISSLSRSAAWPTSYIPSSPLANESDGSEYDWSTSKARSGERWRRESSDFVHEGNDSRRYSDGSDSSRGAMSVHFPRARRSSSKARMSSDSLASLDEEYALRPEMPHRSTSALSNGLRAMTPIHYSGSGSPRSGTLHTNAPRTNMSPEAVQARATLSPSASMSMTRSNSDFAGSAINFSSSLVSTSQHSAKTFRPASYGAKPHLKPSKSTATLALTSSGSDIKGTISSEPEYFGGNHHGHGRDSAPHSSSFKVPNPPKYHAPMATKHTHRPHASSSSIPYLSCSPSSPGSGSIVSARSNASTAPSSSGVRGEIDDHHVTEGGRKTQYIDERERHGSLNSYGLFHQRTPSTPSLTNLVNGYSSSYGRSPPTHASRLSASFDQMASGGTISEVIRNQRIASRRSSSNLLMTSTNISPRRPSYERSHLASYTADSTPTQSGTATRSHSFANTKVPVHEVVHMSHDESGRQRAPSITCTDLERIPSDHSFSSSSAMGVPKRYPPHLRTAQLHASDGSDASGSSPPSPGLPTPGPHERGYSYQHRQRSHPAIDKLHAEEFSSKPLSPGSRSKSRSSFNWEHLPSFVPQYTAMDVNKIRSSKSGTSLHSLPEDEDVGPAQSADSQMTLRRPSATSHKKRLFYFPDDV